MARKYTWMLAMVAAMIWGEAAMAKETPAATLKVYDETLHVIDARLFGQFLERASFGDHGPEAFADADGRLPEKIVEMLKAMRIPIIRFPGGTDVDYIDWRDMIDNVPGRPGPRPITHSRRPGRKGAWTITNRFGYDEYFALRDELKCQTILVVNLLDGMAKRRPLDEAAQIAAGLVAYANASLGAELPAGMPDWPAVRAANGHAAPFGAEFVQIGNEMFVKAAKDQIRQAAGSEDPAEIGRWCLEAFTVYIRAIRAVDPDIKIIIDAYLGKGASDVVQADPYIKANVAYLARHIYAPGGCAKIFRGEEKIDPAALSDEQLWWAWTSMPGAVDKAGQNQGYGESLLQHRRRGFKVASTEWNWNGWDWRGMTDSFDAPAAAGIGAAAFLHGLIRHGDQIEIANQSMLLGRGWGIAAIFRDRDGKLPPHYNCQSSATTFYRTHCGKALLKSDLAGVATRPQPFRFGWGGGVDHEVAELDVLVTADDDRLLVHAINRTFDRDLPLAVDLSDLAGLDGPGVHHTLTFKLRTPDATNLGRIQRADNPLPAGDRLTVTCPARTISIFEWPRRRQ